MNNYLKDKHTPTSWQNVSNWYNKLVDTQGHYFHQHIILPKVLTLLNLQPNSSVLDLACGQGILERVIPTNIFYQGVDTSNDLIKFAQQNKKSSQHIFTVSDITQELSLEKNDFSHAAIILALQNIAFPQKVLINVYKHLQENGKLVIVINHPYFRIPKATSWGIDKKNKIQYRRIDSYLSSQKIPIQMHPSKNQVSPLTWSFHKSLSDYSSMMQQSGFVIEKIEEWISNKVSVGPAAKMENFARNEIPLFMAILAVKFKFRK